MFSLFSLLIISNYWPCPTTPGDMQNTFWTCLGRERHSLAAFDPYRLICKTLSDAPIFEIAICRIQFQNVKTHLLAMLAFHGTINPSLQVRLQALEFHFANLLKMNFLYKGFRMRRGRGRLITLPVNFPGFGCQWEGYRKSFTWRCSF